MYRERLLTLSVKYILQLVFLLLERVYEVMQASTKFTLDEDEFLQLEYLFELAEHMCRSHIFDLKGEFYLL